MWSSIPDSNGNEGLKESKRNQSFRKMSINRVKALEKHQIYVQR